MNLPTLYTTRTCLVFLNTVKLCKRVYVFTFIGLFMVVLSGHMFGLVKMFFSCLFDSFSCNYYAVALEFVVTLIV